MQSKKIFLVLVSVLFLMSSCAHRSCVSAAPVREPPREHLVPTSAPHHYHPATFQAKPIIVLDAGHGGSDKGATCPIHKYQEKVMTLKTAKLLKSDLQKLGYRVIMTRTRDHFLPLEKRAAIANQARGDIFVSVHFNSAPSKTANGIEVHYFSDMEDAKRSQLSERLAKSVLDQIVQITGACSRGVKQSNFSVIRRTQMAAILIEGGFLTHPQERKKLNNPAYLKALAWGIAKGIDNYLK